MCTYHSITMHNDNAMNLFYYYYYYYYIYMPNYYIAVSLGDSCTHKPLKSISNQQQYGLKQEQVHGDHLWRSYSLFVVGIFHSSCRFVKYPYAKNNSHDLNRVITLPLVLIIRTYMNMMYHIVTRWRCCCMYKIDINHMHFYTNHCMVSKTIHRLIIEFM